MPKPMTQDEMKALIRIHGVDGDGRLMGHYDCLCGDCARRESWARLQARGDALATYVCYRHLLPVKVFHRIGYNQCPSCYSQMQPLMREYPGPDSPGCAS